MPSALPADAAPLRTDVSVLYVDPRGPYPGLVADWWDERRDARLYAGPNPVVAHPPCHLWTNMARVNFKRYGGEHNRPGNDGGKFASALEIVCKFGGVLEHPAYSRAWVAHGLVEPRHHGWGHISNGEWCCEVWQSAYGHKARKRTWLWYKGPAPIEAAWTRNPGSHQCGWFDRLKPTLGKREASETPRAFAEWLIDLAAWSKL